MKALLLYPLIPDTYWSFKHILKIIKKKAAHPPLGLLTVAAMMPRQWDMKLVDANIEPVTDDMIRWADLVFIGAMIVQKKSARELVNRCHSLGRKVVGGGPLMSSSAQEFDDIDHIIQGEAEAILPEFLNDLDEGAAKHFYSSKERPDITVTPMPRWDLLPHRHYASLSIQYSRGCPFNCEFCDIVILNGRIPRVKSNDQMIREMDAVYNVGWRGRLFIVDDNFIGNKTRVKSFLREMIAWQKDHGYPFTLYTEASVNLADDEELMELMAQAGFDSVFLGLETPEEDSLRECGKHQNSGKDLLEAVRAIQRHGMEVMGGFIIGFDSDPPNIFERQIKFIQNSGVAKAMIGLLNALPGTRLYERLAKEGRLLDDGCTGDNCDGSLNFVPKMDAKMLKDGYRAVLEYIYSPREYYTRVLQFLKHYRPQRRKRVDRTEVMAFLRSLLYIGLLDKGKNKLYYWRLLFKAFIFHRRSFGEAVSSAIFGYHFRKLLGR
jgi:radical SAM superfamily enzyme YgiQ (UPF0313 family)